VVIISLNGWLHVGTEHAGDVIPVIHLGRFLESHQVKVAKLSDGFGGPFMVSTGKSLLYACTCVLVTESYQHWYS
jgi:hypothetical protein